VTCELWPGGGGSLGKLEPVGFMSKNTCSYLFSLQEKEKNAWHFNKPNAHLKQAFHFLKLPSGGKIHYVRGTSNYTKKIGAGLLEIISYLVEGNIL
jgi:hypothetical protein